MELLKLIQNIFCGEKNELNQELKEQLDACNKYKDTYKSKVTSLLDKIDKLKCENKRLLLNGKWKYSAYVDNKYPSAEIYYKGRTFPNSTQMIEVPVNVLITPNDPQIKADLKKWKISLTEDNYETEIIKLYKKIRTKYYKYNYDKNVWGTAEIWEFPFETFEKMKSNWTGEDCDSWAIFQASYYISAGLNPSYVRVVAGMTSLGGHATVYIFSEADQKFHHLNSTYGRFWGTKLSDYPTHADARSGKDKIGIQNVWFSFNNLHAWHTFKTDADALSYKKEVDPNIIIR